MTTRCWLVEPVRAPREVFHADKLVDVDGNLIFLLDSVLVRAFPKGAVFEIDQCGGDVKQGWCQGCDA